ncbi:MAG: hypothetical protein Q7K16_01005 [Candidatus Azambacteria bacterium]|nr:hypothetical protein [Candidatus Azambacteria bacterium]
MEVRVQSKYLISEELLVNIWHRSAPLDECFSDWRHQSQTDLGAFSSDSVFFWGNWVRTNKGLTPVFLDIKPEDWRIIVNFDNPGETERIVVIKEDESSVYVYRFDTSEVTRFLVVGKDRPQLLEIQVQINEIPEWLAEKIAAVKKEKSPDAILSRLNGLAARLEKLKQRRG